MKKSLLLIIAASFAVFATGQPVNKKTQINAHQKPLDFENYNSSLSKGQVLDSTIFETYTSQWNVSNKMKFTYSINGYTTTEYTSIWGAATSFIWVNSGKTETTVDANEKNNFGN